MRQLDSVILDAEHGCFNADAPPIEGAAELGYAPSGPRLFDDLVGEMSEEIIEISLTYARRLYNALAKGLPKDSGLKPLGALESLKLNNSGAISSSPVSASRVIVDRQTGICPFTGTKLHLKHLTEAQKEYLKQGCRDLALEQQRKRLTRSNEMADDDLNEFLYWLRLVRHNDHRILSETDKIVDHQFHLTVLHHT